MVDLLILPSFYNFNVLSSSLMGSTMALVYGLLEIDSALKIYMLMPEPTVVLDYEKPISRNKRLEFVPFVVNPYVPSRKAMNMRCSVPAYKELERFLGVDVVLAERMLMMPIITEIFKDSCVISFFSDIQAVVQPGGLLSDFEFFWGDLPSRQYMMAIECEQSILMRLMLERVKREHVHSKQWAAVPMGVDLTLYPPDPLYSSRQPPVFFYGGGTSPKKEVEKINELAVVLWQLGVIEKYVASTYDVIKKFPDEDWCVAFYNMTRDDYCLLIETGDVFVVRSRYESSCLSFIEQTLIGQVGVIHRRQWVDDLLPNYPLVAENDAELLELVVWVCRNLNEAREMIGPYIGFLKSRYGQKEVAKVFLATVKRFMDK